MPRMTGNGLTATVTGGDGTAFTMIMTAFSFDAGERPLIDITGGSDNKRVAIAGLQAVGTGSLTGILWAGAGTNPPTIAAVQSYMDTCDIATLTVQSKSNDDCTLADILSSGEIHVTGYNVETSLDETVTLTVNFATDRSYLTA